MPATSVALRLISGASTLATGTHMCYLNMYLFTGELDSRTLKTIEVGQKYPL